jgi:hypothetical protein
MDQRKSGARPSRKPRRKAKSGATGLALGILAAVLLGAVVVVLLTRSSRTPATGPSAPTAELSDRFLGRWEGASPARPSLKTYYEVTRDRMSLTAFNTQTKEWGGGALVSTWRPVRVQENTLIVQTEVVDSGERGELEIVFTSDDAVSITSRASGRLVGNFRRVSSK